jgi:hypothetical protein|nr:MAG TPA_asm: hypothetical protein [Caudoviricetes sp.]
MSVGTEISRLENAKAAITTAIAGKGVTVPSGTKLDSMAALIDSIEAGGGGANELLEWFGGSKYYTTTVTPTSNVVQITITPDDATILSSPKFLLVIPDIPAARNVMKTRAIARAPSADAHVSAVIIASIGQVYAYSFLYADAASGTYNFSDVGLWINRGYAFDYASGITISGGATLSVRTYSSSHTFKGGQPYKVLLIG